MRYTDCTVSKHTALLTYHELIAAHKKHGTQCSFLSEQKSATTSVFGLYEKAAGELLCKKTNTPRNLQSTSLKSNRQKPSARAAAKSRLGHRSHTGISALSVVDLKSIPNTFEERLVQTTK